MEVRYGTKIINVKPIKSTEVLKEFSNELLKINMGKETIPFLLLGFYGIKNFRYIESES